MKIVHFNPAVIALGDVVPGNCCLLKIGLNFEVVMRVHVPFPRVAGDADSVWVVVLHNGRVLDMVERAAEPVEPVEVEALATRRQRP